MGSCWQHHACSVRERPANCDAEAFSFILLFEKKRTIAELQNVVGIIFQQQQVELADASVDLLFPLQQRDAPRGVVANRHGEQQPRLRRRLRVRCLLLLQHLWRDMKRVCRRSVGFVAAPMSKLLGALCCSITCSPMWDLTSFHG